MLVRSEPGWVGTHAHSRNYNSSCNLEPLKGSVAGLVTAAGPCAPRTALTLRGSGVWGPTERAGCWGSCWGGELRLQHGSGPETCPHPLSAAPERSVLNSVTLKTGGGHTYLSGGCEGQ